MRPVLLAPLLAALASCTYVPPTAACARPGAPPCATLADVEVVDRSTGERLPIYWHEGQRWIAGTPGHRYAMTLRNRTGARIMTVVSVDGVNAISGETADVDQGGYVLGPWQSFDVLGWRKSRDNVADFVFTAVADAYASRTGRPDNVGVIGVAVYSEALAAPPSRLAERQTLGTGHGQLETSVVVDTNFEPAQPRPEQIITIRYDRRERLVALGIVPPPLSYRPVPQAFPAAANSGFVADPPPAAPYGIR